MTETFTFDEIKAAITAEQAVRAAGALLMVDTDGTLVVLYPEKISPSLEKLCRSAYYELIWLLTVRAGP